MKNSAVPVYTETLKIRARVIYWLMAVGTVLVVGLPLILEGFDLKASEGWAVAGLAAFMAIVWWFVLASHIKLRLDEQGVHYQFWPLKKHVASWDQLRECYLRRVDPYGEYGGWGLRFIYAKEWGYLNTSDWGLQLVFKDDLKIIISTQRPDEVKAWLAKWSPALQPAQ